MKLSANYFDEHPMAEQLTIFQRARILFQAKEAITILETQQEIKDWFNREILEVVAKAGNTE
tara:strand:- start:701 stop:886 length:186 start_codon:yes stop_codon:yes gene_type:complete